MYNIMYIFRGMSTTSKITCLHIAQLEHINFKKKVIYSKGFFIGLFANFHRLMVSARNCQIIFEWFADSISSGDMCVLFVSQVGKLGIKIIYFFVKAQYYVKRLGINFLVLLGTT